MVMPCYPYPRYVMPLCNTIIIACCNKLVLCMFKIIIVNNNGLKELSSYLI